MLSITGNPLSWSETGYCQTSDHCSALGGFEALHQV